MTASIWAPGDALGNSKVNADNTYKFQRFSNIIVGQTNFTLTNFSYVPNTGSLHIYLNGVWQTPGIDFTENSITTFSFDVGLEATDIVDVIGIVGNDNSVAAAGSAVASANSAIASENSRQQANAIYQNILALSLPSLPLAVENGGTGSSNPIIGFKNIAPAPVKGKAIGSVDGLTFSMMDPGPTDGDNTKVGNVTLTVDSPCAQFITPTTHGQYVTLPDATTCQKGPTVFNIYNNSEMSYGIKDAAGNQLGWVPAYGAVDISLANNATAAGVWNVTGAEQFALTAINTNGGITDVLQANLKSIPIDSNRILFLSAADATNKVWGIVYDQSSNSWGNATLLLSTTSTYVAALVGGQVVIVTSSSVLAVAIAGTTLTPSPTVSLPASAVGSALAVLGVNATTAAIQTSSGGNIAITALVLGNSGVAPTLSAAPLVLAGIGAGIWGSLLPTSTANTILCLASNNGSPKPALVSLNGTTTPVLVSQVTTLPVAAVNQNAGYKILAITGTKWLFAYAPGNNTINVTLLNFTGGALTASNVVTLSITFASVGVDINTHVEFVYVSDTKILVASLVNASTSLLTWLLVDNAGALAANAGPALTGQTTQNINLSSLHWINTLSNKVTLGMSTGSNPNYGYVQTTLDASGTTPTLVAQQVTFMVNTGIPSPATSNLICARNGMYSNNSVAVPNLGGSSPDTESFVYRIGATTIRRVRNPSAMVTGKVLKGIKNNEAWILQGPINTSASTGIAFNRVEMV